MDSEKLGPWQAFPGGGLSVLSAAAEADPFYSWRELLDRKYAINLAEMQVTEAHNNMLDADFTKQEVKDVIFSSYAEGAPGPGPDGFL
jgi:hypothetical protein